MPPLDSTVEKGFDRKVINKYRKPVITRFIINYSSGMIDLMLLRELVWGMC